MSLVVYIIANGKSLTLGYTKDLKKTIALYKGLPTLIPSYKHELNIINRLIYCEEWADHDLAIGRFNELMHSPHNKKIEVIDNVNPDWIELILGVNFELTKI